MEQVILAFEGEKTANRIRDILESGGTAQCLVCHTAAEVKRLVHTKGVTAVVCGYKLRDETAADLYRDLPKFCTVLIVATQSYLALMEEGPLTLVAPASRGELSAAVEELLRRNSSLARAPKRRFSEVEAGLVERAKSLLMEKRGMDEERAYAYLRRKSMDLGAKLSRAAQLVLDESGNDCYNNRIE